jgi:glycogen debranching enzyme
MSGPSAPVELVTRAESHFLYSGKALAVTDRSGWVRAGVQGYYFENTRFLSRDELEVTGEPLKPTGVSLVGHHAMLGYYLASREGPKHSRPLYVTLERFIGDGLATDLKVSNYSLDSAYRLELVLHLDADFVDIKEAEQGQRQQEGGVEQSWDEQERELRFRYLHPQLERETLVRVERAPHDVRWEHRALRFLFHLNPQTEEEVRLTVEPVLDGSRRRAWRRSFREPGGELAGLRQELEWEAPELITSNPTVSRAWRTAVRNLASLPLGLSEGAATPMAGLPLYHDFFGRDALTVGWQALMAMPLMMRDTLAAVAAWRGSKIDDFYDEEPGKLITRVRWGPLSLLGEDPFAHYYGDYATATDFLICFGQYLAWTNDRRTARELLPAVRDVLAWSERYADIDDDGFIEYAVRSSSLKAVKNQGWKDSSDAVRDAEGGIVDNPIASCELQGYLYIGLRQTAQALLQLGERGLAAELLRRAGRLKRLFNERFWLEEEGFYAMGLGPNKEPIRSISSNPGHLLATGIVPVERAGRVVERLMAPDMFSGWGIRTLSSEHPAYNPFSYHLGSVWPVENATIALGMARYGYWAEAQRVAEGVFATSELFAENRLPEALGGLPRDQDHPHPGLYPQSNAPQAWSASAVVLLIQVLLGLRPLAPLRILVLDPHLPEWLPELELRGMRFGEALLDIEAWRGGGGKSHYRTRSRRGSASRSVCHRLRSCTRRVEETGSIERRDWRSAEPISGPKAERVVRDCSKSRMFEDEGGNMRSNRSVRADIAFGALAGVAATYLMDKVTTGMYERESEEARRQEDQARGGKTAYGVAAEKAAGIAGQELSKKQRQRYGSGVHWALGAGMGVLYGALRSRLPWVSLGFGALYGALFWLIVDEGANTALGLTPPPGEFPWETHARGLGGHLVYGVTAETAMKLAEEV